MFDRSAIREGQRVKIAYRDTSRYSGVTGRVVQAYTDRLVVRSEKSGRDVAVSFENIAELESLDAAAISPSATQALAVGTPGRSDEQRPARWRRLGEARADSRRWAPAGVVSAVIWIVGGLAAAYVSDRLGAPRMSGWLAVLTGPVALWVVGTRYGLATAGDWTRAGCLGLLVAWVIFGVGIAFYAMALYG